MSSILDHVEQAVPRATVYGAMKGSPVFIGKYFREVNVFLVYYKTFFFPHVMVIT